MPSHYTSSLSTINSTLSFGTNSSTTLAKPLPTLNKPGYHGTHGSSKSHHRYAASAPATIGGRGGTHGAYGDDRGAVRTEMSKAYFTSTSAFSFSSISDVEKVLEVSNAFSATVAVAKGSNAYSSTQARSKPKPKAILECSSQKKPSRYCGSNLDFSYRNVYTSGNAGSARGPGKATMGSASSGVGHCVVM